MAEHNPNSRHNPTQLTETILGLYGPTDEEILYLRLAQGAFDNDTMESYRHLTEADGFIE